MMPHPSPHFSAFTGRTCYRLLVQSQRWLRETTEQQDAHVRSAHQAEAGSAPRAYHLKRAVAMGNEIAWFRQQVAALTATLRGEDAAKGGAQ